jgi:hypothetical protein
MPFKTKGIEPRAGDLRTPSVVCAALLAAAAQGSPRLYPTGVTINDPAKAYLTGDN